MQRLLPFLFSLIKRLILSVALVQPGISSESRFDWVMRVLITRTNVTHFPILFSIATIDVPRKEPDEAGDTVESVINELSIAGNK